MLKFENEAGRDRDRESNNSQVAIVHLNGEQPESSSGLDEKRVLTSLEKLKRNEMEKTAGWWSKYYASKAKLVRRTSLILRLILLRVEISSTLQAGHGRRIER